MNNPYLFLGLLLVVGIFGKNPSLWVASGFLIFLKLVRVDQKIIEVIQTKGINWGITIITIAVLMPIATGQINFKHLGESMKSPYAWIGMLSGIVVALLGKSGVKFLSTNPDMTVALVLGTIIAVALFKGLAVGPLIGAGIAYMTMQVVDFLK
jgi:uncharacterized membrane protein (DUF441 family)